jgi:putative glutathione S-transferase
MGLLVEGTWHDRWYDTENTGGRFVRKEPFFRGSVTADGSSGFKAEPGRYHLYLSYACPWAHRTLIYRALKGLEEQISLSVVNPLMREHGWTFEPAKGVIADSINGARYLHQVYTAALPDYTGRVTVPVLWDRETSTIVNNESAEIIRMFDRELSNLSSSAPMFCPPELEKEIDEINQLIYERVNNGVYRAGFATTQEAYEEAVTALFEILDELETRLGDQRYLLGDQITEADWRLFTTLIRFDPVYYGHFKCNLRRLVDYPNLWRYTRDLYHVPGVAGTVRFDHIKSHYYGSHPTINPTGVIPAGPVLDLESGDRLGDLGKRIIEEGG